MMVRWSGEVQVNVKSQSELDIGGRETCFNINVTLVYGRRFIVYLVWVFFFSLSLPMRDEVFNRKS